MQVNRAHRADVTGERFFAENAGGSGQRQAMADGLQTAAVDALPAEDCRKPAGVQQQREAGI